MPVIALLSRALAIAAIFALGGCAVGQKFDYADAPLMTSQAQSQRSIAITVLDQRSYILNADKRENFIGLSRGGFGNPFDVTTSSGAPLATEMSDAIAKSMGGMTSKFRKINTSPSQKAAGAKKALAETGYERQLLFTIQEWKTDTMMRTGLKYDIRLDIFDQTGKQLAEKQVSGEEVSDSSILSAGKDAQRWFNEKFSQLLSDPSVAAVLK